MPNPEASPAPSASRRRFRLSIRGLLPLVAGIGLAMGLGRFRLANRDPERARDDPDGEVRDRVAQAVNQLDQRAWPEQLTLVEPDEILSEPLTLLGSDQPVVGGDPDHWTHRGGGLPSEPPGRRAPRRPSLPMMPQ
ncbi:hypothetical protein [Tautonia sociabilis]|uniref:Uncharacterized protein n=1 Tax=Tautonia sociabilis TaxID=2080755 RepID=A0A432MNP2_9BACT|nr:hypothetical protein [Tautonia sociabilis]RUL88726.1 hypothetical protein TsocGM_06210 [Tautonia sociabilis]